MENLRLGIRRMSHTSDVVIEDLVGQTKLQIIKNYKLQSTLLVYVTDDQDKYGAIKGINPTLFRFRFLNSGPLQQLFSLAPAQPGESSVNGIILTHGSDPNYRPTKVTPFGKYFIVNLWQLLYEKHFDGADNEIGDPILFNTDWLEVYYIDSIFTGTGLLYLK